ncbi:MAG: spermine/spermidine synthase domain-containing protein [Planctomycetota bacterium]
MKLRIALLLAALSGFIALSYEIVWIRIYTMVSWGKSSAFGALLGSYLAGLALGALLARRFCRDEDHREMRALALFVLGANLLGFLIVPAVAELVRIAWYIWALPLVGLAAALLGTTFPLIAHYGVPPDERVGARVSYLYGANIIGSTLGSLLTGLVLLDVLTLRILTALLAVVGIGTALGVAKLDPSWRERRKSYVAVAVTTAFLVLLATPFLFDSLWEKLQFKDDYRPGDRFALVVEGASGVVTVTHDGKVYGSGVYDGVFNVDPKADTNGIHRAYAPFAFRPAPRDVLVIGLGSGSWAQVIVNHPSVKRMVVIEISPDYLDVVGFSPVVSSLLVNPKVEIVIDDGRRWLQRHADRFDWIVQNTTYHFRAHATNLLSKEYLEITKKHLNPNGIVVYNTTRSRDAQKTAVESFPHCWLIDNAVIASAAPLVPDFDRYKKTLTEFVIDGKRMFEPGSPDLEKMVTDDRWHDRAWMTEETKSARVITDDNMASEWRHLRK